VGSPNTYRKVQSVQFVGTPASFSGDMLWSMGVSSMLRHTIDLLKVGRSLPIAVTPVVAAGTLLLYVSKAIAWR